MFFIYQSIDQGIGQTRNSFIAFGDEEADGRLALPRSFVTSLVWSSTKSLKSLNSIRIEAKRHETAADVSVNRHPP